MSELNEKQIDQIDELLREQGLTDDGLRAELLDHVCCQVEGKMGGGLPFRQALAASLDTFEEDEMEDIQARSLAIFQQKSSIMKKVSIAALITMLVVCSANWLRSDPPTVSPLRGEFAISSGFGMRMHPIQKVKKQHRGIDFKAPMGTPVQATSDGVVVKVEFSEGYGNHIVIEHDEHFQTKYAQLSRMDVEVGQKVAKGTVIGAVGSSGMSTAPHLHYEVIKDGKYQDPEAYLRP